MTKGGWKWLRVIKNGEEDNENGVNRPKMGGEPQKRVVGLKNGCGRSEMCPSVRRWFIDVVDA